MTLAIDLVKRDGTPVRAEFLRPREWVERNGIVAGSALPIAISELEIEGDAFVTSITACPPVAEGPGRVVTGRFVTRDAGNLVQIALENGTEIRATDVHPIWSMEREEWIPAGELVPGELVDTLTGPVAVEAVQRLHSGHDVYNIEVHGEHVFRVTADGVLVHNACPNGLPNYKRGSFSITDWSGYPSGLPTPTGPFRLLAGAEYDAARKAANQANAALRRADPAKYIGKQIHEIHPIKYGGSPTDPANKVALPSALHATFTTWWNQFMRRVSN